MEGNMSNQPSDVPEKDQDIKEFETATEAIQAGEEQAAELLPDGPRDEGAQVEASDSDAMSEESENVEAAGEQGEQPQSADEEIEFEAPGSNKPAPQLFAQEEGVEATVESALEAVLFASDEPLTEAKLISIVELGSPKQLRDIIDSLNAKYRANNNAFRIERIAGGYQLLTLGVYNAWLQKLVRVRTDSKLSQASIEALAIIAYKQPVIRADVEAIRGVASGEVIRALMFKGLVKIVGRAEILGRPMLYGTTKKFLEVFGLNSLKDLPKIEELKKPQ